MTQSVSFRITRTAEDVAQTLNALSQRLVKLEQRLESVDLQLRQQQEAQDMPVAEMERLDGVDQILQDCRELLLQSEPAQLHGEEEHQHDHQHGEHEHHDEAMAA